MTSVASWAGCFVLLSNLPGEHDGGYSAEQILRLFNLTQRRILEHDGVNIHTVDPELADLQRQVLALLKVPVSTYRTAA